MMEKKQPDHELQAISKIIKILESLEKPARARVATYAINRAFQVREEDRAKDAEKQMALPLSPAEKVA